MTIIKFRTKSKEGGFNPEGLSDAEMCLNPKVFQAVGRVEGWKLRRKNVYGQLAPPDDYILKMHAMVDALCEGKSIEEYLKTL